MRSPCGVVAAAIVLAALPLAALYQVASGSNASIVMHLALAAGTATMALAVFDFRTSRWVGWIGSAALGVLGVIFLLQGLAELTRNPSLLDFAYRVLGQRLEAGAGDVFVAWCIVVLYQDSRGRTRLMGIGAIALVVMMRSYAYYLAYFGRSLSVEAPALISLALLPFGWLLLESTQAT